MTDETRVVKVGKKVLDVTVRQATAYCIPNWLRDLQIRHACHTIRDRLPASLATTDEPVALVSYGPSLHDTWQDVRKYKTIFSCSGAHRFLLDHGIIPTYHLDLDPRPHKVDLMGQPDPRVTYLPASTVHPAYLEHLRGQRILLWHLFDGTLNGIRILPWDEWAFTGGSGVGIRLLCVARGMGYVNLHVYGMDGNTGKSGTHAGPHPIQNSEMATAEYDGVTYTLTTAMAETAREVGPALDQLRDVKATFYGEGLTQAMMRKYVPHPQGETQAVIAVKKPALASAGYLAQQRRMHETIMTYGTSGEKYAKNVLAIVEKMPDGGPDSLLDYGCGKGLLAEALPFPIWQYDPAIPGLDESPRAADLVVCTDTLEHIEPDFLGNVLDDLRRVTRRVLYVAIATRPARKSLPDGRNAHLLIHDKSWWLERLAKVFVVGDVKSFDGIEEDGTKVTDAELHAVLAPKGKPEPGHQTVAVLRAGFPAAMGMLGDLPPQAAVTAPAGAVASAPHLEPVPGPA